MSGYSSKREATEVVRASIPMNATEIGLPADHRAYNLSGMVRDLVYSRGAGYGWGIDPSADAFVASLRRNRRK